MRAALGLALAAALALPSATAAGEPVTVFAASSLTGVFPKIASAPRYSFAGSDQLAFQLRQGAPADVYAAASPKYPQALYRAHLVRKPVTFATNRLVVLVPRSNPARIRTVFDLRRRGIRLVIGDASVPVGSYARLALRRLGIAASVLRNVVSEEQDVKGIVAKVALGEADAGFVYRTDARAARTRTKTVTIPRRAQPTVRYQIAVVAAAAHPAAARRFLRSVLSKRGRRLLAQAGFGLPRR